MLKPLFKTCGVVVSRMFLSRLVYKLSSFFKVKVVENNEFCATLFNSLLTGFYSKSGGV